VASQNLDVAALYFLESAGRGGYGGYLVSRSPGEEWLQRAPLATLVGYPVESVATTNRGRMHATPIRQVTFVQDSNQVYRTIDIKSYPGNSGGPLCVQYTNNYFYPAAVYLGGSGQTVVRAIDAAVVGLINAAEILGNSGSQSTGGGPISLGSGGPPWPPGTNYSSSIYGFVEVVLEPPEVTNWGAGYRFREATNGAFYGDRSIRFAVLANTPWTLQFAPVPFYLAPSNRLISLPAGSTSTLFGVYQAWGNLRLDPDGSLWALGTRGSTYRIQVSDVLSLTGSWTNLTRLTLTSGVQRVTNITAGAPSQRFFRSKLAP
jgi:hypothetical protein